jgi:endonuclease YncB( thermonuclease family)
MRTNRMSRRATSILSASLLAAASLTLTAAPGQTTGWRTAYAIDGDTIVIGKRSVRILGIDTPEVGQRCYKQASAKMASLIQGGVRLRNVSGTDRYGRTLAYVQLRNGRDAGTAMVKSGLAMARYDSRDGYDWHPKEDKYHRLDAKNGPIKCKSGTAKPKPGVYYANCDAVRKAGAAPIRRGQPGYGPHLDRDGDGVACEP